MLKNAIWLFVFTAVILIVFLPSYTRMQDLEQKNAEIKSKIDELMIENDLLEQEAVRLKEDPEYLEKVAREKMGLIREGEVVYELVPEK